jgi:hypothetical protein
MLMLSVTNKSLILSVANKSIMLSVIQLNVVAPSVRASLMEKEKSLIKCVPSLGDDTARNPLVNDRFG